MSTIVPEVEEFAAKPHQQLLVLLIFGTTVRLGKWVLATDAIVDFSVYI